MYLKTSLPGQVPTSDCLCQDEYLPNQLQNNCQIACIAAQCNTERVETIKRDIAHLGEDSSDGCQAIATSANDINEGNLCMDGMIVVSSYRQHRLTAHLHYIPSSKCFSTRQVLSDHSNVVYYSDIETLAAVRPSRSTALQFLHSTNETSPSQMC